jgi:hypothetical protein
VLSGKTCIAHLTLEWLVGEGQGRTENHGRAPSENAPVLKRMYAALTHAAERWYGLKVSDFEQC